MTGPFGGLNPTLLKARQATEAASDARLAAEAESGGRMAENVIRFVRVLRVAGLPLGPGDALSAVAAARAVGVSDRADFEAALRSALLRRPEHAYLFDQAFAAFWRNPRVLERLTNLVLPQIRSDSVQREEIATRAAQALSGPPDTPNEEPDDEKIEFDAALTHSAAEQLRRMDFEAMTVEEAAVAKAAIARMRPAFPPHPTRRWRPAPGGGRIDMRASLRAAARRGGDDPRLAFRTRRRAPPPLVALCDISGSMGRYSRMLLHFLHALALDRGRVQVFLFGTRLTNVTRRLVGRDPDLALAACAEVVEDWSGGTRIGATLDAFNRDWSRRALSNGAHVLLITDGLDRGDDGALGPAAERLAKSCARLVWLNPLLRYDRYAPIAAGARALIAHVDELRAAHSLESLEDLADALRSPAPAQRGAAKALWAP